MLPATQRQLYLSALRPPDGYELSSCIGTTYTLDLMTLLTLPLGFGLLDMVDENGNLMRDPVMLLRVLRKYANRLIVFCQDSGIHPAEKHPLYAHLEQCVIPVKAPREGSSFHPKIWVLRFTARQRPTKYRFLCLSRNITGDPSWDTLLALEGELTDRQRPVARSRPLAEFIDDIAVLASGKLNEQQRNDLRLIGRELPRVVFKPPEQPKNCQFEFFPMGLRKGPRPDVADGARRLLIVSPFLSASFVKAAAARTETLLISREECLNTMDAKTLARLESVSAMIDSATGDPGYDESTRQDITAPARASDLKNVRGLHAKLYIADAGRQAHVWTGSANATASGFNRNVEFLVRLTGGKAQFGIDAFLDGTGGREGFEQFTTPYIPDTPPDIDRACEKNRKAAERLRSTIAQFEFRTKAAAEGNGFRTSVKAIGRIALGGDVSASIRPMTLPDGAAKPLRSERTEQAFDFGVLSEQALTAFLAVQVTAGRGEARETIDFVVKAVLTGGPDDRLERLLHHVLGNADDVLRYLLLLIHDDAGDVSKIAGLFKRKRRRPKGKGADSPVPLLEELSRALVSSPRLLDEVKAVVDGLSRTPQGKALLPQDLVAVWEPLMKARGTLRP